MDAGRELDALVAEKVMGLIVVEWGEETPCPYCGSEMRYCGTRSRCSTCQEWRHGRYKEYSTDIAAAWEVVEKLAAEDKHLDLSAPGSYSDEGLGPATAWSACFGWPTEDWHESECAFDCETACMAICLAALKVIGIDAE